MRRLLCVLLGHKYYVIKHCSYASRHVGCRRCLRQWGMNDLVGLIVPWDGELEEICADRRSEAA